MSMVLQEVGKYNQATAVLDDLIDVVGSNEDYILAELMELLGSRIREYEEVAYPIPAASGAEILHFLMAEHALKQADLREIGSQGVVSEILNGKRELNTRQIKSLATRFQVSPAVFF